ncbi:single-stranded-DNA-specific exonuclease [Brevundimonas phage vB_BpoS-Kabachok]|uniref:Single-stranded-DNA-specific exonuclease n=1 Tax=Brevundimonas phage vB_BpoS-Kabachok TaxID=2948600 RepID=A0A9E7SJW6_9CAUD|nr:single-stranded-DNA-specific exonuclease [Brevundimonas phage vB_BpoS-Kabachok]
MAYHAPYGYEPDVCIYHHPCADGFTAAWAVQLRWPNCKMVPGVYQADSLPDVAGKHVLIVDFSYKPDATLQIVSEAASVTILDHHVSAQRLLEPLIADGTIMGVFDMTKSGAMLSWEFCFGGEDGVAAVWDLKDDEGAPALIRYVQDRDLWTWALPNAKAVCAWMGLAPLDFDSWMDMAQTLDDDEGMRHAVKIGEALVKKQDAEISGAIRAAKRRMVIGGYDVPVANLPYIFASEGGNIMCRGEPFSASYFDTSDGQRSFSLRSDKDDPKAVDVSQVASEFGGGGHKNAAGFRVPAGWEGEG